MSVIKSSRNIERYRLRPIEPVMPAQAGMTMVPPRVGPKIGWHKNAKFSNLADREAGFTLLELLVVIVILGLLIGLVAPAVLRQLGHAKVSIARQSIAQISSVLDLYKLDAGSYPSTQDGLQALITKPEDVDNWSGPYLKTQNQPLDPWGHPYIYQQPSTRPGLEYDLCSLGSDDKPGQPGSPGLICNQ